MGPEIIFLMVFFLSNNFVARSTTTLYYGNAATYESVAVAWQGSALAIVGSLAWGASGTHIKRERDW
jgi:hypothetical protein